MSKREGDIPLEAKSEGTPHVLRRLLRALISTESYGLVLVLIVATYALAASVTGPVVSASVLCIQIVTVWFALHTARARRPVRYAAFFLMAYAVVAGVVGAFSRGEDQPVWIFLASSLLYLVAPFSIVRHIALRPRVDQESMLGAVSAYLLIGMAFAFAFKTVALAQSGPFFGSEGDPSTSETLFFSFTTLTTTGYGNLVPAANPGQSIAVIEMILGQLFLITALGKLVAAWRPKRWTTEDPSPTDEA